MSMNEPKLWIFASTINGNWHLSEILDSNWSRYYKAPDSPVDEWWIQIPDINGDKHYLLENNQTLRFIGDEYYCETTTTEYSTTTHATTTATTSETTTTVKSQRCSFSDDFKRQW